MNAQPADHLNLDELTRATAGPSAANDAPGAAPAAAAARAAFLALGQVVEQAAPPVDAAALLARVAARISVPGHTAPAVAPSPTVTSRELLKLLLTLAASLLFGMAVVGGLSFRPGAQVALREAAPPSVAGGQAVATPAPESPPQQAVAEAPGWDDLDDEISAAAAALEQLRRGSARVDASLEGMQLRLYEMNAEVSDTSL